MVLQVVPAERVEQEMQGVEMADVVQTTTGLRTVGTE
jgi:hypothetical protein